MSHKVFLITGCSSGIGRALAVKLAKQGHRIYAGARNIYSLQEIVHENIIPVALDVNERQQVTGVIEKITYEDGKLDCLINNAGYGEMGPLLEISPEKVESQFKTNVFSPLYLVQMATPLLMKSSRASIVNIGSAAGVFSTPFSGVYCASKAAFHSLSEVMRMELAPLGIHVMTVYPGAVSSSFGENASKQLMGVLAPNSLYADVADAIAKRATISAKSPTTPDIFADELIEKMASPNSPKEIGIGHGSRFMRISKRVLPITVREWLLGRKFQLHQVTRVSTLEGG